ncbi:MAG: hypothetical protein MJ084_06950 [Saccharofermentans sp.]|nr:hypothetical protein [Saccharofermentans sp.]
MFEQFENLLNQKYGSLMNSCACLYPERNAVSISPLFLRFIFIFDEDFYRVVMQIEDGSEVNLIGGREICEPISAENLLHTMEYLDEYASLRLGKKYTEALK